MSTGPKILVAGSYGLSTRYVVDRAPAPGETMVAGHVALDHGGKGSNQAIAAARLGADVTFMTALGRDHAADSARALWHRERVVAVVEEFPSSPTMSGAIVVDRNGENCITVGLGAMAELTADHAAVADAIAGPGWIAVVQNEAPVEYTVEVLRRAKRNGATTILNPAPAYAPDQLDERVWDAVDFVLPNEHEALALLGVAGDDRPGDTDEVARALARRTGSTVVITRGARGAVFSDGVTVENRGVDAARAVDTTGAGDTFTAAFAVAVGRGADVGDAVSFANRAAGHSVRHAGVINGLPRASDLAPVEWRTR
ncbi:ribokinase [Leifsonia lichenia]